MSRQFLIKLFTFLGGIYFFIEYLLPEEIGSFKFNRYNDQITQGFMAVTAMTFGLGLINILFIHGSKIVFKRKGWFNSVGLIVGLLVMLWVTARDWRGSARITEQVALFANLSDFALKIESDIREAKVTNLPSEKRKELLYSEVDKLVADQRILIDSKTAQSFSADPAFVALVVAQEESIRQLQEQLIAVKAQSDISFESAPLLATKIKAVGKSLADSLRFQYRFSFDVALYQLLYDGFFISLGSAMFALLGFYMAAAAYRAFRIRSYESALMMLAAVIVMLGQIPFGIWVWEGFTDIRLWLLSTPSTGAFRAVKFGAAIAGLIMAFRMWLSIETDSFGEQSGVKK